MHRRALLSLPLAIGLPAAAHAAERPPEVAQTLPTARLEGEGSLRFFGLQVYDIRLWAAANLAPERWTDTPLALEIIYARNLYGASIAQRSLDEMRRQGEIAQPLAQRWLADMTRLFPDVGEGDRITGIYQPADGARFFLNGQQLGALRDTDFARRFFGIWLSAQTSEPGLRARLFGAVGR